MTRHTLRDAAIILFLGSGLSVVYNAFFSIKPLPWVRQPRLIDTASMQAIDSILQLSGRSDTTYTKARNVRNETAPSELTKQYRDAMVQAPPNTDQSGTASHQRPRLPPMNDALPPQSSLKVQAVTYVQILLMMRNADVVFMDARRQDEFQQGHIPRAVNVDIQRFELDPEYRNTSMQFLYSIDKRRPIVVYCGGGNCELSHQLADVLMNIGFEHIFIYLGGWNEYSSKPDAPR